MAGAFELSNFVSEGQYHGRHAASFLSARRTASFLQQEEVMFYLETLLYIDHCINVPATGFGKGHFIERKSQEEGLLSFPFCTRRDWK